MYTKKSITKAINQLNVDIEKAHQELRNAYSDDLSPEQYHKLLKTLIELTEAKQSLEFRKENI